MVSGGFVNTAQQKGRLMKRETRRQKLLDLWEDDEEVVEALKESLPKEVTEQWEADEISREAEATLVFFRVPEMFQFEKCVQCEKIFAHTYGKVAYCSNMCRRQSLEDIGIQWNPKSPEERWRPAFVIEMRPRTDNKGRQVESQEDFQDRQNRLQSYYPVPLVVPPSVVDVLSKMINVHRDFVLESLQDDQAPPI